MTRGYSPLRSLERRTWLDLTMRCRYLALMTETGPRAGRELPSRGRLVLTGIMAVVAFVAIGFFFRGVRDLTHHGYSHSTGVIFLVVSIAAFFAAMFVSRKATGKARRRS